MAAKSPSTRQLALNDLRRAKSLLQGEIFTAVNAAVLKFRDTTGLMPHRISIEISKNVTDKGTSYLPTGVFADIELS